MWRSGRLPPTVTSGERNSRCGLRRFTPGTHTLAPVRRFPPIDRRGTPPRGLRRTGPRGSAESACVAEGGENISVHFGFTS